MSENSKKLLVDVSREDLNDVDGSDEAFDVLITTAQSKPEDISNYSKYYKQKQLNEIFENYHKGLLQATGPSDLHNIRNKDLTNRSISLAIPNEDYMPINDVIKFEHGENTKKIEITILNDASNPVMEGLKMFSIEIKPILNNGKRIDSACRYVNPDMIHIVIEDLIEDCKKFILEF